MSQLLSHHESYLKKHWIKICMIIIVSIWRLLLRFLSASLLSGNSCCLSPTILISAYGLRTFGRYSRPSYCPKSILKQSYSQKLSLVLELPSNCLLSSFQPSHILNQIFKNFFLFFFLIFSYFIKFRVWQILRIIFVIKLDKKINTVYFPWVLAASIYLWLVFCWKRAS